VVSVNRCPKNAIQVGKKQRIKNDIYIQLIKISTIDFIKIDEITKSLKIS